MLICPRCGECLEAIDRACRSCRFRPETVNGFVAMEPSREDPEEEFPAESFPALAAIEPGHFWFQARNALIIWALKVFFPGFESLLEVGCGTGFVLSGIRQAFPGVRLAGCELHTAGLKFAAERLPGVWLLQADARRLPFAEEFKIVAAFDVLEHVEEDDAVLRSLYRAALPGGGCLITVPQHGWLWSSVDVHARHKRRYAASGLHRAIEAAGFRIISSTSFVTLLLPVVWLSRVLQTGRSRTAAGDELRPARGANALFLAAMGLERRAIARGVRWRFGSSRLVAARKPLR
jgi:SAM-dependent methyltransferase